MDFIRRWMTGRYGMDQLSMALALLALALMMISSFTRIIWIQLLALAVIAVCILRVISRNHVKRQMENRRFMGVWMAVRSWWAGLRARGKDHKTHVRFRCKSCGQTLRVPRGKGKLRITCPKCKTVLEKQT